MRKSYLAAALMGAALASCSNNNTETMNNPFFEEWTANHGAIPFDKIKVEHYKPAMLAGIEQHQKDIDAIVNNPEAPTFENTIVALEHAGQLLNRVSGVAYNIVECDGTDEMLALVEEMQPIMSEHSIKISLNEQLFKRVESVYKEYEAKNFEGLTPVQARLLKDHYKGYLRAGATLEGEARERWSQVAKELDNLSLKFGQNVQKATGEWSYQLDSLNDLGGLPDFVVAELKSNDYKLTLLAPSYRPFMQYSSRRDLREMAYRAYMSRCIGGEYDNYENIRKTIALRQEKAELLGFKNYAEYALDDRMAKTPEAVNSLLDQLLKAYKPTAQNDVKEVENFAKKMDKIDRLMPWDFSYYSEKLKAEKYNVSDELVKPYFELEKVKKGVFGFAGKLYGLSFSKIDVPVYNPEVECFEVKDRDGSYLGLLYTDFFPRATKRPGAWMTEFKGQWHEADGSDSRPVIQIVMSFSKPVGKPGDANYLPALLTWDEAETFLHEFGHALHGLLSKCQYPSQSGTNVARDFVELPSQFNENYLAKKEFLDTFAAHYLTGEAMPQQLIDRLNQASNYLAGYLCLRQLSFGMLDMASHTTGTVTDVEKLEQQAMAPTQVVPVVDGAVMAPAFTHIYSGGYAAGYYSYKWAEVLDADAFSVFEKEGIFNPATAARFRVILESGDTVDPAELYRNFKGADPTIEALMRRDGIIK